MQQPRRGKLRVDGRIARTIDLQYNPTELSFDKGVQLAEIAIPGLDTPLLQFVRGRATLMLESFFDDRRMVSTAKAASVLAEHRSDFPPAGQDRAVDARAADLPVRGTPELPVAP